jgi:hypothetical protein
LTFTFLTIGFLNGDLNILKPLQKYSIMRVYFLVIASTWHGKRDGAKPAHAGQQSDLALETEVLQREIASLGARNDGKLLLLRRPLESFSTSN